MLRIQQPSLAHYAGHAKEEALSRVELVRFMNQKAVLGKQERLTEEIRKVTLDGAISMEPWKPSTKRSYQPWWI